jgi:hypothetical protein
MSKELLAELSKTEYEPEPLTELEKKIVGQSFQIERCEICGWNVKCPKCGNNSCNGGCGKMDKDGKALPWNTDDKDAQDCDMCDFAYVVQQGLSEYIHPEGKVDYKELYHELLYAVECHHTGETRHQTALRYIEEREHQKYMNQPVQEAKQNIQDNMTKFSDKPTEEVTTEE